MAIDTEHGSMTGDEIVALTKRHTLFEWSAQSKVDPIPVAGAQGHATSGRPRASATWTSTRS